MRPLYKEEKWVVALIVAMVGGCILIGAGHPFIGGAIVLVAGVVAYGLALLGSIQ